MLRCAVREGVGWRRWWAWDQAGASGKSTGIRERQGLWHSGVPGAGWLAPATDPEPAEDGGGRRQAVQQAGRLAGRFMGEGGHMLGLGGEDQPL